MASKQATGGVFAMPKQGALPAAPPEAAGKAGATYSTDGQSQQDMIARLDQYVTAHGGTLIGVQFDPNDVTKGFFIIRDNATLAYSRYDFYVNSRANTVSVTGPQPWQV